MTDSELEQRLRQLFARQAGQPADTPAAWREFTTLRVRKARDRTRRLLAAGTAAVAVAGVAVAVPAITHWPDRAGPSASGHPVARAPITITARIPVPGAVRARGDEAMAGLITSQRGQVWTITYRADLLRIDPSTNRVTLRVRMPGVSDLTAGAGSIWLLGKTGRTSRLRRLDPVTGRVVATFPLSGACGLVSYAADQLWVACGHQPTEFLRLDPATGRTLAASGPANGVMSMAATPDGIWYSGNSGVSGFIGAGRRLRWRNAADTAHPVSLAETDSLVYGQGALWAFSDSESVAKIDPATGQVVRIYDSARYDQANSLGLNFFAVGQHSLWFLADDGYEATSVLRVSLATGRPQGQVSHVGSCGEPCWQIYFTQGSAWVPTRTQITRVSPAG